jgi:hypothetical protein
MRKEAQMRRSVVLLFALVALVAAKSIVLTLTAPDGGISGLAWGGGNLWAVDEVSDTVYELDPNSGAVISSFGLTNPSTIFPTGLAYSETQNMILVGFWDNGTNGYVYKYTYTGGFLGSVTMCGG